MFDENTVQIEEEKSNWFKRHKVLTVILMLMTCMIASVACFFGVQAYGQYNLHKATSQAEITLQNEFDTQDEVEWEDGWIRYDDKIYEYNEDILSFLILGIDNLEEVDAIEEGIGAAQADAIFLVVCNPDTKQIQVLSINRNSMVDLYLYDENEYFAGTQEGQITLQYGYGNGQEFSCEIMSAAVSRLLYGMPIHGYCAINMGAIPELNDAIGGVEVTIEEEIVYKTGTFEVGTTEVLLGERAYYYLQNRDTTTFDSVSDRTERHMEYMKLYVDKLKTLVKEDMSIVFTLYNTAMDYMVTDVSIDRASYLATTLLNYEFGSASMISLEGATITGEKYEEFYVDDEVLYDILIEVFYQEVELN